MRRLLLAVVLLAVAIADVSPQQPGAVASRADPAASWPFVRAQYGNQCADQFANCADGCAADRTQCTERGAASDYCGSVYRTCMVNCDRFRRGCSARDRLPR